MLLWQMLGDFFPPKWHILFFLEKKRKLYLCHSFSFDMLYLDGWWKLIISSVCFKTGSVIFSQQWDEQLYNWIYYQHNLLTTYSGLVTLFSKDCLKSAATVQTLYVVHCSFYMYFFHLHFLYVSLQLCCLSFRCISICIYRTVLCVSILNATRNWSQSTVCVNILGQ